MMIPRDPDRDLKAYLEKIAGENETNLCQADVSTVVMLSPAARSIQTIPEETLR